MGKRICNARYEELGPASIYVRDAAKVIKVRKKRSMHQSKNKSVAMQLRKYDHTGSLMYKNGTDICISMMTLQTTVIICIRWPKVRVGEASMESLRTELLL